MQVEINFKKQYPCQEFSTSNRPTVTTSHFWTRVVTNSYKWYKRSQEHYIKSLKVSQQGSPFSIFQQARAVLAWATSVKLNWRVLQTNQLKLLRLVSTYNNFFMSTKSSAWRSRILYEIWNIKACMAGNLIFVIILMRRSHQKTSWPLSWSTWYCFW